MGMHIKQIVHTYLYSRCFKHFLSQFGQKYLIRNHHDSVQMFPAIYLVLLFSPTELIFTFRHIYTHPLIYSILQAERWRNSLRCCCLVTPQLCAAALLPQQVLLYEYVCE